jgi:hypothetical protein
MSQPDCEWRFSVMMFFEAINHSFEKRGRTSTDGGPKMRPPAGDNAGGRPLPKKHCLVLFMAKLQMSPRLRICGA